MLPLTSVALRERRPQQIAAVEESLGEPVDTVARRFAERAGASRLRDIGVTEDQLLRCAEAAVQRPELSLTPPPARLQELADLYRAAW
jgi:alcohol dehydrogenase class IV